MLTFYPDIGSGSNCKAEKEEDKAESLKVVGCHTLDAVQDGSQQLAL